MEQLPNQIIKKLSDLGIKDIKNPSIHDIKIFLDAFLKSKEIDVNFFDIYVKSISPTLKILFEGLTEFTKSSENVSNKTLEIINTAINILGSELTKELTEAERAEIRNMIYSFVKEARKEAEDNRGIIKIGMYVAGGAVIVLAGVALTIVLRGRGVPVVLKGASIIAKAVALI